MMNYANDNEIERTLTEYDKKAMSSRKLLESLVRHHPEMARDALQKKRSGFLEPFDEAAAILNTSKLEKAARNPVVQQYSHPF